MLSTTVLSHYCTTIALSDYRKNSLLWLTKCFPALHEWGLLMHLPHPKEVNIARVILVFQDDSGVKQTKGNYRHLLHSKSPKYVTQRWGGSGIFWESSNTSEGQYVSGLEFKYFQILHQRDPVYMGKSDWWISGGCRIGSILSSGSRLWIKKFDSEPPFFFPLYLFLKFVLVILSQGLFIHCTSGGVDYWAVFTQTLALH